MCQYVTNLDYTKRYLNGEQNFAPIQLEMALHISQIHGIANKGALNYCSLI